MIVEYDNILFGKKLHNLSLLVENRVQSVNRNGNKSGILH